MKRFQKWVLVFGLVLAGHARAAENYSGAAVDEKGQSVAGATVDCYHYQTAVGFGYPSWEPEFAGQTVTDGKGLFTVPGGPGSTLVLVKKAGLATTWKTWSASTADSSGDPVVLSEPTTLAGKVVDENNQAVAGAEVSVSGATIGDMSTPAAQENQLGGKVARGNFFTRTAADGHFRIENFPADGHADLVVIKSGKAQRLIGNDYGNSRDYRSGDKDIELLLGPAGAVVGKVVVAETGQPLGGVKLELRPSSSGFLGTDARDPIKSGADGTFHIPDIAPGLFYFTATIPSPPMPDWVVTPENLQVTVVAGETASNLVAHVSKGAVVEVTVVSTNDLKPVADAVVSSGSTAYTDSNGVAFLRLPTGTNWLFARKDWDWRPQTETVVIVGGQTNHVRIELTPPPTITGTVRDSSGAPAAGVLVSFHPGFYPGAPDYTEVMTDKSGGYKIVLKLSKETGFLSGSIMLTNFILARSLERDEAAIQEFEEMPTKLDLNLQPGITLSGFVKDTQGAPVSTAVVNLSILAGGSLPKLFPRPTKVDAQGSFAIPALPQGREYGVFDGVTAKGYGAAWGRVEAKDTRTNRYSFATFVLKRADRILAGQVVGPDGKPLAGANVGFSGAGQRQWSNTRTDSKGLFTFDAVCEGEVHLTAFWIGPSEDGGAPPVMSAVGGTGVKAQAGDTNVVIQLRNPNAVAGGGPELKATGTVFDPSGAPVAGVSLRVWRSLRSELSTVSRADGKYTVHWQRQPIAYAIAAEIKSVLVGRDVSRNLVASPELEETTTNLDLHLQPGVTLSGSVWDAAGRPVANARVDLNMVLNRANGALEQTASDAEGAFHFKALPPAGEYYVNVTAPSYTSVSLVRPEIGNTPSNQLEIPPITLLLDKIELAGTVLDPAGATAPGVVISALPSRRVFSEPDISVESDANGKYIFPWQPMTATGNRPAWGVLFGRDLERNLVSTNELDGVKSNLDLRLEPGLDLSGAVQDAEGKPVTNAVLQFTLHLGSHSFALSGLAPTNTDALGVFSVRALPQGAEYEVRVSAAGYGRATAATMASQTRTNQFRLPPFVMNTANLQIEGEVLDQDNKPCAGARVTIIGDDQPVGRSGLTDSSGHFVIKQVCEGLLDVRAMPPARSGSPPSGVGIVQAHGGDTNVVLKLGEEYRRSNDATAR